MKGILMAGGIGSGLYPLTKNTSKQLLPVCDKPMVFYPLSTLMEAGIRDILLVTTEQHQSQFEQLLGDGSRYGITLSYCVQPSPGGVAQGILLAEEFIGTDTCALILGDNLFFGDGLGEKLKYAVKCAEEGKTTVFGCRTKTPERFGVLELGEDGRILSLEEKPACPKSDWCIAGLYFYHREAVSFAKQLLPSGRGELEITDLNQCFLKENSLRAELLGETMTWMDMGTPESLRAAAEFICAVQKATGSSVGNPEEIARRNKWIA